MPKSLAEYIGRYDDPAVGLAAELMKKDNERRLMHELLTEAGVPTTSRSGEGICLIGRLAVLVSRKEWGHAHDNCQGGR